MPFDGETFDRTDDLALLRDARAKIARGWCQNVTTMRRGRQVSYCMLGAMGYDECFFLARARAEKLLGPFVPAEQQPITVFNDDPSRTQAEVVAVFDRAIAALEAAS